MSKLQKKYRSGKYTPQPNGYKSFLPTPLPPNPPILFDDELQKKLSEADRAIARLDTICLVLANSDLFISMFVKKEALLSSQIEGTQATLENVLEFERSQEIENVNDVAEVINYISALNYGMKRLKKLPMSTRLIKELHAILMQGVRGKNKTPGAFKKTQNWIGPAGCLLKNATFVPPAPKDTLAAMSDLEKYMHKANTLPPLIDCALIHYQFETIHPFLDGNGRLGRLLITYYLYWKKILDQPVLYLSYYFKKNRQKYYRLLNGVRHKGNYEKWISFFLDAVIESSKSGIATAKKILKLQEKDRKILSEKKLATPLAIDILFHLFYQPIVTIPDLVNKFGASYTAVSNIVSHFQRYGILKEQPGRQRSKRFVYTKYLEILSEGTEPL